MKRASAAGFGMALVVGVLGGCGNDNNGNRQDASQTKPDLSIIFENQDMAGVTTDDGGGVDPGPDPCGDSPVDPNCYANGFGPPGGNFPLSGDPMPDPLAKDNGVNRDVNGWLKLDSSHTVFNYLWIANDGDLGGAGSASKLDTKTVREVARYRTVTCSSLKTGSSAQCDGTNGCCSVDDWPRFQARLNKMPEPGHQPVQTNNNSPSRTSVDFNGDLFISNRAFGGQSSVTKIANDPLSCVDRNRNGRIDTSSDVNGDGFIETDCNGNGKEDDIADVQGKPCSNNMKQEFYDLDDECVIWTSNTFQPNATGRPLGLSSGDSGASDAWAGSYDFGTFVRIDGITGKDKASAQLPNECYGGSGPYGLAVDAAGIGWSPNLGGGKLCYFDTVKPMNVGSVRDPQWGQMEGYGVTLDRDQNVWVGSGVERYSPDRSNGFKNLGSGWWTKITGRFGIGIAADSRSANEYFVYSCDGGGVLQIPASTIKVMKMDQQVNPNNWAEIQMPCYGVGVDNDQNVWGVDMQTTTRALVDKLGKITQPTVNGPPKGNNKCPAGDSCPNAGAYTYSDFTGFGLRNFTRPSGTYQMLVKGCTLADMPVDTQWFAINWDADVPPNTSLSVHAKAGNSSNLADASWINAQWTPDVGVSPSLLQNTLMPNLAPGSMQVVNDSWLLVEFVFKTSVQNASPRLKNFNVAFKCDMPPG